jgi:uncharacterized membrane protein
LKIGDPNITITGTHTYTIQYQVKGGFSYPRNQGPELYYNVTGSGWEVPIHQVTATISSPDSIFLENRSCYRDIGGSNGSCSHKKQEDGSIFFRTTELMPGEGMTIAQALDARNVERVLIERFKVFWILIPLLILALGALGTFIYRFKTAYKTGNPIIAQYEPYPGVKPMYTGLLMDGRLDPRDITACIVYLAERGFLKIRKTEKKVLFLFEVDDYEIELLKLPDDSVSNFEKSVLELFLDNPFTIGKIISLRELKNNLLRQHGNYKKLTSLQKELDKDLEKHGFYEGKTLIHGIAYSLVIGIVISVLLFIQSFFENGILANNLITIGVPMGVIIVMAFAILVTSGRRTQIGYEIQDYLKGFKLFLEMTEKERYDFHNAPEKSPEQFMEYLPYAIAFGVEDKWAKVFEGITIPNPEWYDGGSVSTFNATNLTTSLGAFSTAFAASSGTSASSGGGHAGGGSGGGGGGSW